MNEYETIDEFLKLNNIDRCKDFELSFQTVVRALDYNTCKQILLSALSADGITIEKLKKKFLEDRNLNNVYNMRRMRRYGRVMWKWDIIGDEMLHNAKRTVSFRLLSDCNRTCIAKECAGMVIKEVFGI